MCPPPVCVLQGVQGTGAGGRIVSRDVAAAGVAAPATGPSTAGPYQTIELSNMRKVSTLIILWGSVHLMYISDVAFSDHCKTSPRGEAEYPSLLSDCGYQHG